LPCHFSFAVRARDHRGLDGDLQAEGDRRRTRLRAEAQRRMAAERLSCLARNGRSPGEESLTAVVAAQAIEAQPSFGQIKPSEAAWLAGPTALRRRRGGYRITCTRGQPRRATEKKPWRTDGSATARHDVGHTALPSRTVSHPLETPSRSHRSAATTALRLHVGDQGSARQSNP
jgi:hypothetical protein